MSLMNGLSALGSGVANFAGEMAPVVEKGEQAQALQSNQQTFETGLVNQKAALEQQQAVLADQLASASKSAEITQQAGVATSAASALASVETARAAALASTQATAAQTTQKFELAKQQAAALLPTPGEREVIAYSGAQPGTPEYKQGVIDMALVKAGVPPSLFGAGGSGTTGTPSAPASRSPSPVAPMPPLAGPRATSASSSTSPAAATPAASPASGAVPATAVPSTAVPATEPALDAAKATPGEASALPGGVSGAVKAGDPVNGQSEAAARLALVDNVQQTGLHPEVLTGQPPGMVNLIKGIAAGKVPIPQGNALKTGYWPAVLNLELLYKPGFNEADWQANLDTRKSVAAGPIGAGITAANTVLQHANEFVERAADLNNGQIPAGNYVANAVLNATGSPRPLALQTTVDALAAETRKVYAGQSGGTQADLDAWQKNFPIDGSPAQQSVSMKALVTLLHGRLTAVADQINGGMQTNLTGMSLLNPEAKAAFDKLSAPVGPDNAPSVGGRALAGAAAGLPLGPPGVIGGAIAGAASAGLQAARDQYRAAHPAPAAPSVPPWVKPGDQYSPSRGQARGADGTIYGAPQ